MDFNWLALGHNPIGSTCATIFWLAAV